MSQRIPPIQCLLSFEALSRLRSVTQAAEELFVTPSAVSHRIRQLEQIAGTRLFGRGNFDLTAEGTLYLERVREGLSALRQLPGHDLFNARKRLRVAAPPTFARTFLMPRLRQFIETYPEIDLSLQVSIALFDVQAEASDLSIRFGTGNYTDLEHICLLRDEVTPLASPAWVRENGPFDAPEDLEGLPLLRSALEPWRTWFDAHQLDWLEPINGWSFNDTGLVCDAASQGLGVGLVRLKLAAPWLESGQLIRLFDHQVPSPHAHYLCWRAGAMDRWECAAFAEWLKRMVS
jgi:LysR family transcriptional regulator, glycine cleavage system transcriptional activator